MNLFKLMRRSLTTTVLFLIMAPVLAQAAELQAQHDQRMAWFRDARFGLFIHWGVYSVPAGGWNGHTNYGEWFLEETKMPVSQYEKFAGQFNPVKFNAKEWVRLAKEAGMKYLVITSKHHDGFGMFRSSQTDWCIKSTPFRRDPLKELADACRKEGLRLCFYYSIMDWHHPDWGTRRPWNDKATGKPDMDRYVAYMKAQLKELITRYGPVGILWFDGDWEKPAARHHHQQPRRQGPVRHGGHGQGDPTRRRLRHAGAGNPGHRLRPRRGLGIVHDHE
jgi:alpha-L-fucosidase